MAVFDVVFGRERLFGSVVTDEFQDVRRNALGNFFLFLENIMPSAGVGDHIYVGHAGLSQFLSQTVDALQHISHGVVCARQQENREVVQIMIVIDLFYLARSFHCGKQLVKQVGSDIFPAQGIAQILPTGVFVAGEPVSPGVCGFELVVVDPKGELSDKVRRMADTGFPDLRLHDGFHDLQNSGRLIAGTHEDHATQVIAGKADHIVPEKERSEGKAQHEVLGIGELLMEKLRETVNIIQRSVPARVAICFSADEGSTVRISLISAMAPEIKTRHGDSVCGKVFGQRGVAAHVFCHSVDHL